MKRIRDSPSELRQIVWKTTTETVQIRGNERVLPPKRTNSRVIKGHTAGSRRESGTNSRKKRRRFCRQKYTGCARESHLLQRKQCALGTDTEEEENFSRQNARRSVLKSHIFAVKVPFEQGICKDGRDRGRGRRGEGRRKGGGGERAKGTRKGGTEGEGWTTKS